MQHMMNADDSRLLKYVEEVRSTGEPMILFHDGRAVAEIRPLQESVRLSDLKTVMDSLPHLSKEEADLYAHDLDAIRKLYNSETTKDPWL